MAKTLTENKKELLRKFVNHRCENCHNKSEKLIPHRIHRGYLGGEYTLNNIKMLCPDCHKAIHYKEF